MTKLYNSVFEMQLRILLLLSQTRRLLSKDEIVDFDFITLSSADFSIGAENLHGYSEYRYGEFASRHELVGDALKDLVVDGLIAVVPQGGFFYKITSAGLKYVNSLESTYSVQYREIARQAFRKYENKSEAEIEKDIRRNRAVLGRRH